MHQFLPPIALKFRPLHPSDEPKGISFMGQLREDAILLGNQQQLDLLVISPKGYTVTPLITTPFSHVVISPKHNYFAVLRHSTLILYNRFLHVVLTKQVKPQGRIVFLKENLVGLFYRTEAIVQNNTISYSKYSLVDVVQTNIFLAKNGILWKGTINIQGGKIQDIIVVCKLPTSQHHIQPSNGQVKRDVFPIKIHMYSPTILILYYPNCLFLVMNEYILSRVSIKQNGQLQFTSQKSLLYINSNAFRNDNLANISLYELRVNTERMPPNMEFSCKDSLYLPMPYPVQKCIKFNNQVLVLYHHPFRYGNGEFNYVLVMTTTVKEHTKIENILAATELLFEEKCEVLSRMELSKKDIFLNVWRKELPAFYQEYKTIDNGRVFINYFNALLQTEDYDCIKDQTKEVLRRNALLYQHVAKLERECLKMLENKVQSSHCTEHVLNKYIQSHFFNKKLLLFKEIKLMERTNKKKKNNTTDHSKSIKIEKRSHQMEQEKMKITFEEYTQLEYMELKSRLIKLLNNKENRVEEARIYIEGFKLHYLLIYPQLIKELVEKLGIKLRKVLENMPELLPYELESGEVKGVWKIMDQTQWERQLYLDNLTTFYNQQEVKKLVNSQQFNRTQNSTHGMIKMFKKNIQKQCNYGVRIFNLFLSQALHMYKVQSMNVQAHQAQSKRRQRRRQIQAEKNGLLALIYNKYTRFPAYLKGRVLLYQQIFNYLQTNPTPLKLSKFFQLQVHQLIQLGLQRQKTHKGALLLDMRGMFTAQEFQEWIRQFLFHKDSSVQHLKRILNRLNGIPNSRHDKLLEVLVDSTYAKLNMSLDIPPQELLQYFDDIYGRDRENSSNKHNNNSDSSYSFSSNNINIKSEKSEEKEVKSPEAIKREMDKDNSIYRKIRVLRSVQNRKEEIQALHMNYSLQWMVDHSRTVMEYYIDRLIHKQHLFKELLKLQTFSSQISQCVEEQIEQNIQRKQDIFNNKIIKILHCAQHFRLQFFQYECTKKQLLFHTLYRILTHSQQNSTFLVSQASLLQQFQFTTYYIQSLLFYIWRHKQLPYISNLLQLLPADNPLRRYISCELQLREVLQEGIKVQLTVEVVRARLRTLPFDQLKEISINETYECICTMHRLLHSVCPQSTPMITLSDLYEVVLSRRLLNGDLALGLLEQFPHPVYLLLASDNITDELPLAHRRLFTRILLRQWGNPFVILRVIKTLVSNANLTTRKEQEMFLLDELRSSAGLILQGVTYMDERVREGIREGQSIFEEILGQINEGTIDPMVILLLYSKEALVMYLRMKAFDGNKIMKLILSALLIMNEEWVLNWFYQVCMLIGRENQEGLTFKENPCEGYYKVAQEIRGLARGYQVPIYNNRSDHSTHQNRYKQIIDERIEGKNTIIKKLNKEYKKPIAFTRTLKIILEKENQRERTVGEVQNVGEEKEKEKIFSKRYKQALMLLKNNNKEKRNEEIEILTRRVMSQSQVLVAIYDKKQEEKKNNAVQQEKHKKREKIPLQQFLMPKNIRHKIASNEFQQQNKQKERGSKTQSKNHFKKSEFDGQTSQKQQINKKILKANGKPVRTLQQQLKKESNNINNAIIQLLPQQLKLDFNQRKQKLSQLVNLTEQFEANNRNINDIQQLDNQSDVQISIKSNKESQDEKQMKNDSLIQKVLQHDTSNYSQKNEREKKENILLQEDNNENEIHGNSQFETKQIIGQYFTDNIKMIINIIIKHSCLDDSQSDIENKNLINYEQKKQIIEIQNAYEQEQISQREEVLLVQKIGQDNKKQQNLQINDINDAKEVQQEEEIHSMDSISLIQKLQHAQIEQAEQIAQELKNSFNFKQDAQFEQKKQFTLQQQVPQTHYKEKNKGQSHLENSMSLQQICKIQFIAFAPDILPHQKYATNLIQTLYISSNPFLHMLEILKKVCNYYQIFLNIQHYKVYESVGSIHERHGMHLNLPQLFPLQGLMIQNDDLYECVFKTVFPQLSIGNIVKISNLISLGFKKSAYKDDIMIKFIQQNIVEVENQTKDIREVKQLLDKMDILVLFKKGKIMVKGRNIEQELIQYMEELISKSKIKDKLPQFRAEI